MKKVSKSAPKEYDINVFINCPFDDQYLKIFHALVFAVADCGFIARCAQEADNGAEVRVQKILRIIRECRIGIHDISRTEVSPASKLPRFNMPLELGMFLGAKEYGSGKQIEKTCLVLDRDPHRYQKFISDIGGQDIHAHARKAEKAIREVRNFLGNLQRGVVMPGPTLIHRRYLDFTRDLPALCKRSGLKKADMTFNNYVLYVEEWLKGHPKP